MSPKPIERASNCTIVHARHRTTNKEVAIKVVDKEKINKKMLAQFHSEAELLGRLSHSNIVKMIEVIETESKLYIVMQCYGGDL